MKKVFVFALLLLAIPLVALGEYRDNDGILGAVWTPPPDGNPPSSYTLHYIVNGIDSTTITVPASQLKDSSIVLSNVGDYAYYTIFATDQFGNNSVTVQSDSAYFDIGTVNPSTPGWE